MDQNKFARWSFRVVLSILLITCFLPGSGLSNIRQRYQSTSITTALPEGTTVTTISYGSDARQKIQLFQRPIPFKDKSIYLAVYIPGGGWKDHKEGWQEEYNRTELLLLLENYVHVAYIDFRPTLEGQRWPAQELDWIAAFEILQKYLKPAGIVGWGHSAGAHGILTLATHPSIGPLFQALVAKSAPSDLRDSPEFWIRLFGNLDPAMTLIIEASPYFKAGSITADTLIIHGEMDQMVSYHQSENLYYAILENGGRSDLILLENANHILKPFVPDLSVELSSEEIAKATTCYMLDKLLLKHPEYVRKWINNNRMKLNHPNDKDARLDKKVCMGQDILEIKDCETEDSMYYRIYCQQNNKLDLLAEIPKTGRITCYEVDIAQINASGLLDSPSQEFLVTRVLTSGKESRTSQTFSDFRKYCD